MMNLDVAQRIQRAAQPHTPVKIVDRATQLGVPPERYQQMQRDEYDNRIYVYGGMLVCRYCGPDCRCISPDGEDQ